MGIDRATHTNTLTYSLQRRSLISVPEIRSIGATGSAYEGQGITFHIQERRFIIRNGDSHEERRFPTRNGDSQIEMLCGNFDLSPENNRVREVRTRPREQTVITQ